MRNLILRKLYGCSQRCLWLGLAALVQIVPAAAQQLPVKPFAAYYTVYFQGAPLGDASIVLEDGGAGRYRMESDVRPNEMAAMLIAQRFSERVSGEFRDGRILPNSYEQQREGGKRAGVTRLNFDWRENTVLARDNDKQASLPLSPRVVDPLSLHLLLMLDLRQGRKIGEYTLVDRTKLKTYQASYEGEEILETPVGKLRTLRVSRQKPGSSRRFTVWFAADLAYLPVRISHIKKGKEQLRMTIHKIAGH